MLSALLDFWKQDDETAPNLFAWQTTPPPAPHKRILFQPICLFRFEKPYLPAADGFVKKSQKTPQDDLDTAHRRLKKI